MGSLLISWNKIDKDQRSDKVKKERGTARSPRPFLPVLLHPKHLDGQILTSRSAVEGERKIVTVLFADVANFTSLSEKLDPEEVHQVMDGCFQILMAEILRYEGAR